MEIPKIVGQTKDVGFEIGARRTFPISVQEAWDFLFSPPGLKLWIGDGVAAVSKGQTYHSNDGTEGMIKVYKLLSHVRLTWKKKEWKNSSTLQIRVIKAKNGTTISFHQEKLLDSQQREEMKQHWEKILEDIKTLIKP